MRFIGGKLKGLRLNPPSSLPSRPTTDRSKEALFNILNLHVFFEDLIALDLFSGTGSIALELASRGAQKVIAVETHFRCCSFIQATAKQHRLENIQVKKENVFRFLKQTSEQFDLIFADPPFDLRELPELPTLILQENLLLPGGLLIIEHPSQLHLPKHPFFQQQRKYGFSSFSFYKAPEEKVQ